MSSWFLVIVVWSFLAVQWVCLRFVIVVFPDHTYLLFFMPPTVEKLKGHIASGLSVRPSARGSVQNLLRYSCEVSYMDSSSKIIDTYFFKSGLFNFMELCPF